MTAEPKGSGVFKGAILYVLMRWTDRLVGFISTLILARILVPADFGIIAMTSLVIGLVDIFMDLGVNIALIQNRHPSKAHYDTAWTLRIVQACITVVVISLIAPFAADYFHDQRITLVLRVMSLGALVAALENIGIVTFQKEMRADMDFKFTFSKRIAGLIVTITAALLLRSYWALVLGTIAGRLLGVVLSYRFHSMRPSLSLEQFKEIFSTSQWMLINSVGNYLNNNLHKMLVGGRTDATTMGNYALGEEISAMPSSEILSPLNRVLFPAFVQAKHDLNALKQIFLLAQGVQCMIAIPASMGLAFVANDAVMVLLGAKWLAVVPFIEILALSNIVQAITTSSGYVLLSLKRNRAATLTTWVQVILFSVVVMCILRAPVAADIAWVRVGAVCAGLIVAVGMLLVCMRNVSLFEIAATTIRPSVGTALMGVVIVELNNLVGNTTLLSLLVKITCGALVYAAAILAMWIAVGRPEGAESYVLKKLRRR